VFRTRTGTALSAGNVRRDIRAVLDDAGLVGQEWTPRELRHSFVSLLSEHRIRSRTSPGWSATRTLW